MFNQVKAVAVDHETSRFSELMIRSFCDTQRYSMDIEFTLIRRSIMESDLPKIPGMNIRIVKSPFQSERVNTHGENLSWFVTSNADCDFYLFLDSDIVFIQKDTLQLLISELEADPSLFAVQARLSKDGLVEQDGGSEEVETGGKFINYQISTQREAVDIGQPFRRDPHEMLFRERVHPCCCLVRNTQIFRAICAEVGLSVATLELSTAVVAHDTLGLLTTIMKILGYGYRISNAMVIHYGGGSYKPTTDILQDCERRLETLKQRGRECQ